MRHHLTRTAYHFVVIVAMLMQSMYAVFPPWSVQPALAGDLERNVFEPQGMLAGGQFGINSINAIRGVRGITSGDFMWVNTLVPHQDPPINRYDKALQVGAAMNRWVLAWYNVELFGTDPLTCTSPISPSHWDWSGYEDLVTGDAALPGTSQTLIVLNGVPKCYQSPDGDTLYSKNVPVGLDEPMFLKSDGTTSTDFENEAASGDDGINPANPWGCFVYYAVKQFGDKVKYWQVWNEENSSDYWPLEAQDYSRLVEVAYFAARHTGKDIKLVLGGLSDYQDNRINSTATGDQRNARQARHAMSRP